MEDTSGFFKAGDGVLLGPANNVFNANFTLHRTDKDTYTYPVDGWRWFDDENAAYEFFGLEQPSEDDIDSDV